MKLYHGSSEIVQIPNLAKSRVNLDFGVGFYLTEDINMAKKWACKTEISVLNEYTLNTAGLAVKRYDLDTEWLECVSLCRSGEKGCGDDYDIIIGPVADDKLFVTLDLYEDGIVSAEEAIRVMDCMHYGKQVVIKTEKAVGHLQYVANKELYGQEKQYFRQAFLQDGKTAAKRTKELLQTFRGGR